MAALFRAFVVLALLLASNFANAVMPVPNGSWVGSVTGTSYSDPQVGLEAQKAHWDAVNGGYVSCRIWTSVNWVSATEMSYGAALSGCAGGGVDVHATWSSCPANSDKVGNSCVCKAGTTESANGLSCEAPSGLADFCQQHAAAKNTWQQSGTIGRTSPMPTASCYKPDPPFEGNDATRGCAMTLGDIVAAPREGDPLLKDWSATGVMTGGTCEDAAATDAAPKAADDPCPGGFQGTVNGVSRCVAAEPDKGIEGVKGTSQTAADGTKIDTKETTKCEGSNCTTTTTTTTTTASGAVSTSTTSRTEGLADKCAKDPTNGVCTKTQGGKGAGVSQSTCQENPSAQGCGGEGAGIGDLYAKKDKTIAQVMKKASDDLKAAPLGGAVGGFFTVGSGGTCPSPSGVVPFLNKAVTFDMFCTTFAAQMFLIARMVLLMLATWMAFRVAIDH